MNPREPRPAHRDVEPWRNDTQTDRWLNSTGYAAPSPAATRRTVDEMRQEWQHHDEQLRRKALIVVAVTTAVMITITTTVTIVQARCATRCAPSVPATVMAVTP